MTAATDPLRAPLLGILHEVRRGDVVPEEALLPLGGLLGLETQRAYQRGYEDGRAAEAPGHAAIVRDVALNLLRVGRLTELDAYLRGVIPPPGAEAT